MGLQFNGKYFKRYLREEKRILRRRRRLCEYGGRDCDSRAPHQSIYRNQKLDSGRILLPKNISGNMRKLALTLQKELTSVFLN